MNTHTKKEVTKSNKKPRRLALAVHGSEFCLLDLFRQIEFKSYPASLARETFSENTIRAMKRKGWLKESGEGLDITETGRLVFAACAAQLWHDHFAIGR